LKALLGAFFETSKRLSQKETNWVIQIYIHYKEKEEEDKEKKAPTKHAFEFSS
jgi:hypothetical protein